MLEFLGYIRWQPSSSHLWLTSAPRRHRNADRVCAALCTHAHSSPVPIHVSYLTHWPGTIHIPAARSLPLYWRGDRDIKFLFSKSESEFWDQSNKLKVERWKFLQVKRRKRGDAGSWAAVAFGWCLLHVATAMRTACVRHCAPMRTVVQFLVLCIHVSYLTHWPGTIHTSSLVFASLLAIYCPTSKSHPCFCQPFGRSPPKAVELRLQIVLRWHCTLVLIMSNMLLLRPGFPLPWLEHHQQCLHKALWT